MLEVDPFLFRGPFENIKKFQQIYLPFFNECNTILDLGCGRGEFLRLLQEAGKNGIGIDYSDSSIEICKEKGFSVVKSDIFSYLESYEGNVDGIFCAHVVEHLTPEQILYFIELTSKVLRKDGILIIVTPNFQDFRVVTNNFWLDMTHVRPYPYVLLTALFEEKGLITLTVGEEDNEDYIKNRYIPLNDDFKPVLTGLDSFSDYNNMIDKKPFFKYLLKLLFYPITKNILFRVLNQLIQHYDSLFQKLFDRIEYQERYIKLLAHRGDVFMVIKKQ